MKNLDLLVGVLLAALCVLTACSDEDCEPESGSELCGDRECGEANLIDQCGDERTVDCGQCPSEQQCSNHECHCMGETQSKLCDDHDLQCGSATVTDQCGDQRLIDCGECNAPDECLDNHCQCMGQSEAALCDAQSADCGSITVTDQCGDERTLNCGECSSPDECLDNRCQCDPESEAALCDAQSADCGSITVTDQCGDERALSCGECSSPDECLDNRCQCDPESEAELCTELAGICGPQEVVDRCGDNRSVNCAPCPNGDTSLGAIRDAATGALLEDATIRVYTWPPAAGQIFDWIWPEDYRRTDPDFHTTTGESLGGELNFEFATEESICIDDQIATLVPHQWYRYVIEKPGYRPGIYYRPHGAYDSSECPELCPTAAGTGCHRQEFELWPDTMTYPKYPNLIADPRELAENEWQCTLMPDDSPYDRLIGLRVRLGAANVGHGDFHLEGVDVDGGQVLQYIHHSDGSIESHDTESATFEYHEDHRHTHFMDWFGLRLIDPRDECRDTDARPSDCYLSENLKISFCLHDLDPFDGDVASNYDGYESRFPDPPVCSTTEQGVTVAWKDTYNRQLPGQVLILGAPDSIDIDEGWIEAEMDPNQVLKEIERHGNIARRFIEVPDDPASLCSDPSTTLDCSMPPEQYSTTRQQRQCRDYTGWDH